MNKSVKIDVLRFSMALNMILTSVFENSENSRWRIQYGGCLKFAKYPIYYFSLKYFTWGIFVFANNGSDVKFRKL